MSSSDAKLDPAGAPDDQGRPRADATAAAGSIQRASATTTASPPADTAEPTLLLAGAALGDQWLAAGGRQDPGFPSGPRYRMDELLGAGSTGRVYAVYDHNLQRTVALKALIDHGHDARRIRDFITEAALLARLDHPNVVPVHDIAIASSGQPFFTMKRVAGQTLGEAISQMELPGGSARIQSTSQVVSIFIDVCKAVSYAHHHRVIHQDIKPDNILLGEFGEVLLLDWGSALSMEPDGTIRGQSYGTPLYMSPEQTRGECATGASDTYCIGASCFQALLLRIPTWSEDPTVFWEMKRSGTIQEPTASERQRVPAPLLSIVLRALRPKPEERYPTIDDLLRDLQRYQSGLAVEAHRDSLRQFIARWCRQHRQALAITLMAGVFLLVVGLLWYRSWLKEQSSWSLVFQDDFDRPAGDIAKDWRILTRLEFPETEVFKEVPPGPSDSWYPAYGGMSVLSAPANNVDLICRRSFPGNLRVEWDYENRSSDLNLNCFLGSDRKSGYTFHVGGWRNPNVVALTQGPTYRMVDWSAIAPIRQGRTYHFLMERDEGHIRLTIDGHPVIDYRSLGGMDAPDQPTFGLDTVDGLLTARHLRVYTQRPPLLVSPLATADAFFSVKAYPEALNHYRVIEQAYPGSDLGTTAEFGAAISLSRCGEPLAGDQALQAFQAHHPDHELIPYCLWERLHIAVETHHPQQEQALREELQRFIGSPVLRSVIVELSEAQTPLLTRRITTTVGEDSFPPDIVQRLEAAIHEIVHWSTAYHISSDNTRFIKLAAVALLELGQPRQVVAQFTRESFPSEADSRLVALYMMGRFDELQAEAAPDNQWVLLARQEHCNWDATQRSSQDPGFKHEANWRQERDQVLRDYHAPGTPAQNAYLDHERATELISCRLQAQAQTSNDALQLVAKSLLTIGADGELINRYPQRQHLIAVCAMRLLQSGRQLQADGLFDALRHRQWDFPNLDFHIEDLHDALFTHYLFPPLYDFYRGRLRDPRPLLAATLPILKDLGQQQDFCIASYALGRMDDQAFRRQLVQWMIDGRLALARGLRADLAGDRAAALEAYRDIPPPSKEPCFIGHFAAWRRAQLTPALPASPP